jgi:adenosylmethionine---8-amino-7-oxononanoate aminotransferase
MAIIIRTSTRPSAANSAGWRHTSFLGFTKPAAIELAQAIVALFPNGALNRVFFSDDGSTGIEVALRVADKYWRLRRSRRYQFIAFQSGYHGDTAGAASLGAVAMFQTRSPRWKFPATQVSDIKALEALAPAEIATRRTGRMFGSEYKGVIAEIMVLGKGLSGGYLPIAITLISEQLFSAFNGSMAEGKAFAYGHSYPGNALGSAAARACLEIFENERVLEALQPKIQHLSSRFASLKELHGVKEVRQCGFIAGIETARARMAAAVCIEARRHGLLTRPIWNVVVLMPPLCITMAQLTKAVEALHASIIEVWRCSNASERKDAEEVTA